MGIILLTLILLGASLSLITCVYAIRSWLSLRRARAELRDQLTGEVARLAHRAGEVEKNLSALNARASRLPVRISELQHSLATLRILTNALSTSLQQVQRALSFAELKVLSATRISDLLDRPPKK